MLSTSVEATPERCFDLSLDVGVHLASGNRERVVHGVDRGVMGLGDEVTWEAWHFGIPWRMTSVIVDLRRPSYFVDEMKSGPFARWRHEHHFSRYDHVVTTMVDRVKYEVPFGWIGRLVDGLLLARYVERLLVKRNTYIKARAEFTEEG